MRILIVEDEQKVSALVQGGLTAERYAVDVASDGIEGLELAEAYPYDLILVDLMLPRLAGGDLLQRIRRKNTSVPVLVLTARDSIDDKVKLFEKAICAIDPRLGYFKVRCSVKHPLYRDRWQGRRYEDGEPRSGQPGYGGEAGLDYVPRQPR